jgi:hypothetical protein
MKKIESTPNGHLPNVNFSSGPYQPVGTRSLTASTLTHYPKAEQHGLGNCIVRCFSQLFSLASSFCSWLFSLCSRSSSKEEKKIVAVPVTQPPSKQSQPGPEQPVPVSQSQSQQIVPQPQPIQLGLDQVFLESLNVLDNNQILFVKELLGKVQTLFECMNRKIDPLNEQIHLIEKEIESRDELIGCLRGEIEANLKKILPIKQQIEAREKNEALRKQKIENNGQIKGFLRENENINEQIEVLNGQITKLRETIVPLKEQIEAVNEKEEVTNLMNLLPEGTQGMLENEDLGETPFERIANILEFLQDALTFHAYVESAKKKTPVTTSILHDLSVGGYEQLSEKLTACDALQNIKAQSIIFRGAALWHLVGKPDHTDVLAACSQLLEQSKGLIAQLGD